LRHRRRSLCGYTKPSRISHPTHPTVHQPRMPEEEEDGDPLLPSVPADLVFKRQKNDVQQQPTTSSLPSPPTLLWLTSPPSTLYTTGHAIHPHDRVTLRGRPSWGADHVLHGAAVPRREPRAKRHAKEAQERARTQEDGARRAYKGGATTARGAKGANQGPDRRWGQSETSGTHAVAFQRPVRHSAARSPRAQCQVRVFFRKEGVYACVCVCMCV